MLSGTIDVVASLSREYMVRYSRRCQILSDEIDEAFGAAYINCLKLTKKAAEPYQIVSNLIDETRVTITKRLKSPKI